MRPVFPQERLDRLRNTENQKFEITKKQKWSFVFFMLNSSALYQIGVMYAEYYFNNSRLPLSYHFLIWMVTSSIAVFIGYLTKNKSLRFNKVLAALITLAMVLVALFIPRPISG
ncbi:hypothetical protein L0657_12025 [Dyadobacter sp. CY345]|uniref:hypothetical protein n=1 Tax=Dyadobacter sp. CY345 TaxID=2909335 RepID=UPI001F4571AA|nr:hypothetical protein [Dyadobacter sp. CY345]MCF2444687.1 hypothetical protein [Dyadobacter sp. CY345]